MLRIAFAGTPEFAVPTLQTLASSPHQLVGVLTQPDRAAGRGRQLQPSAIKRRALELQVPISQPERLASEAQRAMLREWALDLLVVVAYGLILPPAVLELPRLGCVNVHASLLPRWRGAAPIQRAVLAGDVETGVAVMAMERTLDTGPIYAEERVSIDADMTAGELEALLAQRGASLLMPVIDALENGLAHPVPQPSDAISYAHKISKAEARIDWHRSAEDIARQVRAFNPRPIAETDLHGERVRIWRARAERQPPPAAPGVVQGVRDGALWVACGEGQLAIQQLQWPGRRTITAHELAQSRQLAGVRFT